MILFVKNVGKETTAATLTKFFDGLLFSLIPFCSGKVDKVQLYTIYDNRANSYEYHALCHVKNTKHAKKILHRLRLKHFNGRRLYAREFKHRVNMLFGPHEYDRRRGKRIEVTQNMKIHGIQEAYRRR